MALTPFKNLAQKTLNQSKRSISRFSGAELDKLTILKEQPGKRWQMVFPENKPMPLFNPNEIQITKTTQWRHETLKNRDRGDTKFIGGDPATLTLDLFFDTYEGLPGGIAGGLKSSLKLIASAAGGSSAVDVRQYTNKIFELTLIDSDLKRPPVCELWWGSFNLIFKGYLGQLTQRFTLFTSNGMPVRAALNCTFHQFIPEEDEERQRPSSLARDDDPIHVVRRGETLSSIAGEEYNDPSVWREIAKANGITNPRHLTPGQVLTIPVLNLT
ncbi:LysM peptidoglycan-binding domain-containing protein [Moorena sp. SIOASIH]|uniref:CIS tube protein n=1 Tax=Moorena sp. SIOASIH TaxID=2607817 RepID=UPI0025D8249F|nr:LysM peptidoglycan-binding domain-containing protein [Moorena sp. SIOASIH]